MKYKILLATAYLPPVEYFSLIAKADEIFIEREENYNKQTFRNRCTILSSNGPMNLTVPVLKGSELKTLIKDIRIDYTKRWQQVHLRAISSSYGSSPYFQYYFEDIERIINFNHRFLLDLNTGLLVTILKILKLNKTVNYTSSFKPAEYEDTDFRYKITPKRISDYSVKEYIQVFNAKGFIPGLSIADLIFNTGAEAVNYL